MVKKKPSMDIQLKVYVLHNGRTTRKLGFRKQCLEAGLEPWKQYGKGHALPDVFHDPRHKAWELGYGKVSLPLSNLLSRYEKPKYWPPTPSPFIASYG